MDVRALWIDPFQPGKFLAATGEGMLRSEDSGDDWTSLSVSRFSALATHPKDDSVLIDFGGGRLFKFPAPGRLYQAGDPAGRGDLFDGLALTELDSTEASGRLSGAGSFMRET